MAFVISIWVGCGAAFSQAAIESSPLHRNSVTGDFRMQIVEHESDGSGKRYEITITLFDGEPISAIRAEYICSQGIIVCGVALAGRNKFEPTLILLDQDLREVGDLCDLAFVFTYPAYAYLYRFDWEADDAGLLYFTQERRPPNFAGIESWKVDRMDCSAD
jgi:hypothetical protein